MFANDILSSPLLLAIFFILLFTVWAILDYKRDYRIFVALNFSIILIWIFYSNISLPIRVLSIAFILIFLYSYKFYKNNGNYLSFDKFLSCDIAYILILFQLSSLFININIGLNSINDKGIILDLLKNDKVFKYFNYMLGGVGLGVVHLICLQHNKRKWNFKHIFSIFLVVAGSFFSTSKASVLPIMLSFIFIYGDRIKIINFILFVVLSISITIALITPMFNGLDYHQVSEIALMRVLGNVDVLDYIDELNIKFGDYKNSSIFYVFWPFFQFFEQDFVIPGIWLHGMVYDNWQGFGPNPTFLVDLIIAPFGLGIVLAPFFGSLLKIANISSFRVLLSNVIYLFLQDWYMACIYFSCFIMLILVGRYIDRLRPSFAALVKL